MSGNELTDLVGISELKYLRTLDISQNPIDPRIALPDLQKLPMLRNLSASVHSQDHQDLLRRMLPNLRQLNGNPVGGIDSTSVNPSVTGISAHIASPAASQSENVEVTPTTKKKPRKHSSVASTERGKNFSQVLSDDCIILSGSCTQHQSHYQAPCISSAWLCGFPFITF